MYRLFCKSYGFGIYSVHHTDETGYIEDWDLDKVTSGLGTVLRCVYREHDDVIILTLDGHASSKAELSQARDDIELLERAAHSNHEIDLRLKLIKSLL